MFGCAGPAATPQAIAAEGAQGGSTGAQNSCWGRVRQGRSHPQSTWGGPTPQLWVLNPAQRSGLDQAVTHPSGLEASADTRLSLWPAGDLSVPYSASQEPSSGKGKSQMGEPGPHPQWPEDRETEGPCPQAPVRCLTDQHGPRGAPQPPGSHLPPSWAIGQGTALGQNWAKPLCSTSLLSSLSPG